MVNNKKPIPFSEFMQQALYDPEYGYYSTKKNIFGAKGDFVTAPQVSKLYSHCIARRCKKILQDLNADTILEIGAGTGAMAKDIVEYLDMPIKYYIYEPNNPPDNLPTNII